MRILVTCEHAGNRVPPPYRSLFRGAGEALRSHRGWDPGAHPLARTLAGRVGAPLRSTFVTRLLVDANRPEGSRTLFSEWSARLPPPERERIRARYHTRHWTRVRRVLDPWIEAGETVLHMGAHTFTPLWEGRERQVDVGILFDPARRREARLAERWMRAIARRLPALRVRVNEPYLGTDEGLTTHLRGVLPAGRYLGIEIEVNQAIAARPGPTRRAAFAAIAGALAEVSSEAPAETSAARPGSKRTKGRLSR